MLTFAIVTFFSLTMIGAVSVIGTMLFGYRSKITGVVRYGLARETPRKVPAQQPLRPTYNENSGTTFSIVDRLSSRRDTGIIGLDNYVHNRMIRS